MSISSRQNTPESDGLLTKAIERASPGIAALLDGVSEDRTHCVLDLAAGTSPALEVYRRFASWVRFAGILDGRVCDTRELAHRPGKPDPPYDLVLAWDVLDRVPPEERPFLVQQLTEASAPNARLYVLISAPDRAVFQPTRFTLLDVGLMRCEPLGPLSPAGECLLPAELERLLIPFQVVGGFTLRPAFREYVAVRRTSGRDRGSAVGNHAARGTSVIDVAVSGIPDAVR